MSYKNDFNVFVGGLSGVFKGINISKKSCVMKNIQNLVSITSDHEITAMSWDGENEKCVLIGCGGKNIRSIKIFDTEHMEFKTSFKITSGEGVIKGIEQYQDAILTAVESGHVALWRDSGETHLLNAGPDLCTMRQHSIDKHIVATGGKENKLKLFDIEKQQSIFEEKNVPHDWLELRVPIWVTDTCFLPDNSVASCSKYGHIRLYDVKSQRRPVVNLELKDESLTCIAPATREKHVIAGSGKGRLNLIDLRNPGRILNTYKGFAGGVSNVACSKVEPLVVSVSLDRYLRVHNLDSKELVKKVYLTSRLKCIALRSCFSLDEADDLQQLETIQDSDDST